MRYRGRSAAAPGWSWPRTGIIRIEYGVVEGGVGSEGRCGLSSRNAGSRRYWASIYGNAVLDIDGQHPHIDHCRQKPVKRLRLQLNDASESLPGYTLNARCHHQWQDIVPVMPQMSLSEPVRERILHGVYTFLTRSSPRTNLSAVMPTHCAESAFLRQVPFIGLFEVEPLLMIFATTTKQTFNDFLLTVRLSRRSLLCRTGRRGGPQPAGCSCRAAVCF